MIKRNLEILDAFESWEKKKYYSKKVGEKKKK